MWKFCLIGLQLPTGVQEFFLLLGEADLVRTGGVLQGVGQVGELGAIALLLLVDIVGAHPGQQVPLVAVEVDEGLEAVFLAAVKEPVDGPFLIGLAVVGKEIVEEVGSDDLLGSTFSTQSVGDDFQVLLQGVLAVDHPDEVHELAGEVVLKVVVVADGENVVGIDLNTEGRRNFLAF